jgi:DNA-directed RNA polymerase subunit N (RpoN/RPB10)
MAHIQMPYEKKLDEICKNHKLTEEEKGTEKQKLINSFKLKNYCCKQTLITYIDLIKIIK